MAIDRAVLEQQILALGESSRWWDHRELRDLPAVLSEGEEVLAISRGKLARVRWLRRSWLIVITDRRMLCLRSTRPTGWQQVELTARQISGTALRVGLFRGRLRVSAGGHTYRLLVPRPDAYRLQAAMATWGTTGQEVTGFGPIRVVRRLLDHVFALPAVALSPESAAPRRAPKALPAADPRVPQLEEQIDDLRQQVEFLEELLRKRQQPE